MNVAHLCVLIAALLPFLTVGSAKAKPGYDNAAPRAFLGRLEGWRARANWAHQNHFEAFAPFAAGVILAEMAHAPQGRVDTLAVAFVVLRVLYTFVYIAGVATVRTLIWTGGLACSVWLLLLSV
jgi:uncharacterized MAPEG superfamily protein